MLAVTIMILIYKAHYLTSVQPLIFPYVHTHVGRAGFKYNTYFLCNKLQLESFIPPFR